MARLTEKQEEFLRNPFVGVVTTIRPDGSPHSTVVWVDDPYDGVVSFNTATGRVKPENIERDPRVSLLVVDPGDPYRWIAVDGPAEISTDGADEQIDKLAKKYLDKDAYPWRSPTEQRLSVAIRPRHVDSHGLD
jgi:PPOX class probable F420-dependent enzyme